MKKSAMALATFLLIGLTALASSWAAVTVNITNPANNAQFLLGETIFLQGNGEDDSTAPPTALTGDQLTWLANGEPIGTGEFLDWEPTGAGTYRVSLIGEVEGISGVKEIQVKVLLQPPVTVNISNPANNAQFLVGETIFLQGSGTDGTTSLTGGELAWYANGSLIGTGELLYWRPAAGNYRVSLIGTKNNSTGLEEIEIRVLSEADLTLTVSIESPTSGSTYESGEAILFIGKGSVEETGENLSGSQLVWYSNRDGNIGTGTSFSRGDLSPGTHVITLVGDGRAIATITLTITSISIYLSEPIRSGEVAVYDWGKNILYIPLLVGDTPYFINLAVTNWTSDPVQMSLRYIGPSTFDDTYHYASFDVLSNTLLVPDFRIGNVSYKLILKLTTNEDPFVFNLMGSILNH